MIFVVCIYHWLFVLIISAHSNRETVQQCTRDGKNAINFGVFSGHVNVENMVFSLVKISTRSMSKYLKSQNSEDTSRLLFVAKSTIQPRQLGGVPTQSNIMSIMCKLIHY